MRISQIITERVDQAHKIKDVLDNGYIDPEQGYVRIETVDELLSYIRTNHTEITKLGKGKYSIALKGESGDYILKHAVGPKLSKQDPWDAFARVSRTMPGNPLFPRILWLGELEYRNGKVTVSIMEEVYLDQSGQNVHNATKKAGVEYFQPKQMFKLVYQMVNYPDKFDEASNMLLTNSDDDPMYKDRRNKMWKFVEGLPADPKHMEEFMKVLQRVAKSANAQEVDIHSGNFGFRKNGELVIFDPLA